MIGDNSDDVFADFRSWVISRGRTAYEAVLADPDAGLAVLPLEDEEEIGGAELFGAQVPDVYVAKTGRDVFDDFPDRASADFPGSEPTGPRPADDRRERRQEYPQLTAKYPPRPEFDLPRRDGARGVSRLRLVVALLRHLSRR